MSLPHRRYPCDECPFRRDNGHNPAAQFPAERWEALSSTAPDPDTGWHPGLHDPMFGCHKGEPGTDEDLACAGWLATVGEAHVRVRVAVATGELSGAELSPGENWPPLHASWADVVAQQTRQEDEP